MLVLPESGRQAAPAAEETEKVKDFLHSLSVVADHPLALIGYLAVVLAWLIIGLQSRKSKALFSKVKDLPEGDRLKALELEYRSTPKAGLSAEQWMRSRVHLYIFSGFAITCFLVLALCLAAVFLVQAKTSESGGQSGAGDTFDLTVRLRPPDSSTIVSGSVTAELGNDTKTENVIEGAADFKGIARSFWGKRLRMSANVQGYSSQPQYVTIASNSVDFTLQKTSERTVRGQLNPVPRNPQSVRVAVLDNTGKQLESVRTPNTAGEFQFSVNAGADSPIRIGVCISSKLAFDDFEEFTTGRVTIIKTKTTKYGCPF